VISPVYLDIHLPSRKSPIPSEMKAYTRSTSSGLSKGAIGGIVGGILGGLLILGIILAILYKRRKRRRATTSGYTREKESAFEDGSTEPKVEPYIGQGEVDLSSEAEGISDANTDRTMAGVTTSSATHTYTGTSAEGQRIPTGLEREVKQMLGVAPPFSTAGASRTLASSIPEKSNHGHGQSRASPTDTTPRPLGPVSDPSSPVTNTDRESTPSRTPEQEREVEYVRHTDGGTMQVELPPLYTDIPRRID
jgi:hypothetical protein